MINEHRTWVVIANSNTCRIYNYTIHPKQLLIYKLIEHPENKMRDIDLTSDKPGRYKSSNAPHSSYDQPSDPKEIKIDTFAREVAKELDHGRTSNLYDNIILIASPSMQGLLFQHMDKHVKSLIINNIGKDIMSLKEKEILDFLHKHIYKEK